MIWLSQTSIVWEASFVVQDICERVKSLQSFSVCIIRITWSSLILTYSDVNQVKNNYSFGIRNDSWYFEVCSTMNSHIEEKTKIQNNDVYVNSLFWYNIQFQQSAHWHWYIVKQQQHFAWKYQLRLGAFRAVQYKLSSP